MVIVFVNIVDVVRDRVVGAPVSNSRTVLKVFGLLFLFFFQLATLIFVMYRFSTVVARQFGSVSNRVCFMLAHSVNLWLIRSFQTVQFQFLFKVCDNLCICAVFRMGLID